MEGLIQQLKAFIREVRLKEFTIVCPDDSSYTYSEIEGVLDTYRQLKITPTIIIPAFNERQIVWCQDTFPLYSASIKDGVEFDMIFPHLLWGIEGEKSGYLIQVIYTQPKYSEFLLEHFPTRKAIEITTTQEFKTALDALTWRGLFKDFWRRAIQWRTTT